MVFRRTSRDHCTFSNYEDVRTTHIHLDLVVDFDSQTLTGSATLTLAVIAEKLEHIILDTRDVTIQSVELADGDNWKSLSHSFGEPRGAFGTPLDIVLSSPAAKGDELKVRLSYQTSKTASALCWLRPEQTDGGKQPYLFSQCQSIHARSIVPSQDSPAVKASYTALITVPKTLTALMSAISVGTTIQDEFKTCQFEQKIGIPSYLIALAVGDLVSKDISPRVRVWSEEKHIDAAHYEFAETEDFVTAGEAIAGPYVWGRYDVLMLPGSFPYGGMENPCLTFVTPTLLAGDRSLADVIAHEVSHSWTGNLVTNATWEDFWLNEGFTMMLQRLIVCRVHNNDKLLDFDAITGQTRLASETCRHGEAHAYTVLRTDLTNDDPDDTFGCIPYEKGFSLLYYLMKRVGKEAFVPWLKDYIQTFQHKCIEAEDFRQHFIKYFTAAGKGEAIAEVDWEAWFDKPGLPPAPLDFSTELADASIKLGQKWIAGGEGCSKADIEGWVTLQKIVFLDTILEHPTPLPVEIVKKLDSTLGLSGTKNCEILHTFLEISLKSKYMEVIPILKDFVARQGRMKYVRPLYRKWKEIDAEAAKSWFTENRGKYHNICSKMLGRDLLDE